jgi:hypothetical protein
MTGQYVFIGKNAWGDESWTIDSSQVSDFVVNGIAPTDDQSSLAATVSFKAMVAGKGIDCREVITYQEKQDGTLYPVDIVPIKISKAGNW